MDFNNYYFHAICTETKDPVQIFDKILRKEYILSRAQQGDRNKRIGGYNGINYISLCNYAAKNKLPLDTEITGYTAFDLYIKSNIAFILNKEGLNVITPILVRPCLYSFEETKKMWVLGNDPDYRYSDLPDEVQVQSQISLRKALVGVAFPVQRSYNVNLNEEENIHQLVTTLKRLKRRLKKYGYPVPIYDTETATPLTTKEKASIILERVLKQ